MDKLQEDQFTSLNLNLPLWERFFTIAPLLVVGTKEDEGYDLAPKHMAMSLGHWNYLGFIYTPRQGTYKNVRKTKAFTVSFPTPDQVVSTSLRASPILKGISKSERRINALPLSKSSIVDAPLLKNPYLYLECKLYKIIDRIDDNSVITGTIKAVIDVRVLNNEDGETITKKIHGLRPTRPDVRINVEGGMGRPPMERTHRNQKLWKLARAKSLLLGLLLEEATAGGGSDGNTPSTYTATLDGLGAKGDGAHAQNEFIFTDQLPERTALLTLSLASNSIKHQDYGS